MIYRRSQDGKSEYEEECLITKEEYLKNLDLQDFLNCKETKEILKWKNTHKFDLGLKQSLMRLFENCAKTYSDQILLFNDLKVKKIVIYFQK